MSPSCFRSVFDEIPNEWPDGFVVINKRRKPIPSRRWYHFTSAFFLSDSASSAGSGVCRESSWCALRLDPVYPAPPARPKRFVLCTAALIFDNPQVKTSNPFKILFCILAGVFIAVWFFYVPSVPDLIRQYRAQSFPKTEGRVLSVGIVSQKTSKGGIYYHPTFLYKYEIDGKSYKGLRYRYVDYLLDYDSVNRIVTSHPAGSAVEVYYNPANPAEAVLSPLVDVQDASQMLLASPFLYVSLFFLLKFGREIDWPGRVKPGAGGVKIITEKLTTRVRLPCFQPGSLGLSTTCILSIIAGFVIPFTGASSPVPAGLFALSITIGAGALVYFRQYRRIASGIQDLVIDESARTVELPLTCKRCKRRRLAFSDIKAVGLEHGRYGVTTYAPTLLLREGSSERLTDLDRESAESFVAWLWEKLGRPMPASEKSIDSVRDTG